MPVLYITVSTLEEHLGLKEVTVSQVEKGNIVLFNDIVQTASVNNNTLKVEDCPTRAGTGDDTAQYAGVTVHNLQVGFDTRSVSGASESNTLTF